MRVIIKPAGFIALLLMLSVLGIMAFLRNQSSSADTDSANTTLPATTTLTAPNNLLINASFEDGSEQVNGSWPGSKGSATGEIAKNWIENSLWGEIKLEYALDKENPHSGSTSQRIKIVSNAAGQVQFVQERPAVVGKNYEATVWVRASEGNLPVGLLLRQASEPYKPYKSSDVTVGTKWQKISVVGSPTEAGNMYTLITFKNVGATLWIDDASLVEVP
ncbi:MAG: carbohydrate binding domain-containing protein [Fibrella sp.]|nr:carbohydrate binding domain-containing protein [Armatimonadota bacterium]